MPQNLSLVIFIGFCMLKFSRSIMPATPKTQKKRAPRNRTLTVPSDEKRRLKEQIFYPTSDSLEVSRDRIVCGDAFEILKKLPLKRFDLLFVDPPYNLTKDFGHEKFRQLTFEKYEEWLDSWLSLCVPLLKGAGSVYICGDWRSSGAIQRVGMKYFHLQNRITWEREKGRGAKANWKNAAEDIWFFTVSDRFAFDLDAVK